MTLFSATLIGRAGADPQLIATTSGKPMASVSAAVDQFRSGEKTAPLWIKVLTFGELATRLTKNVKKGHLFSVTGTVQTRTWLDKENKAQTTWEFMANNVVLLPNGPKPEATSTTETSETDTTPQIPDDMP